MKCSKGVIAGVLVMLVAACGSNAAKGTTAPAAPSSHASATTPAPDLNSELLAVSDFPPGWSSVPPSDSTVSTPQCFQNVKTDLKPASKAEATFQGGSSGLPLLDESLGYLPGRGQQAMAQISQVLAGCGHISFTTGGDTLTGTVGAMSYPPVGDQSSAWQINLTGTVSGISVTLGIDFVAFRKTDTVGLILFGDLGTPDIQTLQQLVQVAAAKL